MRGRTRFFEFYEQMQNQKDQGIVVYHGSDREDIDSLEGGAPPYQGGIGTGVYVGIRKETGEFICTEVQSL